MGRKKKRYSKFVASAPASGFKDVPVRAVPYINALKAAVTALVDNKITSGVSKTAFGTTQNVKRGDFANFLLRADKATAIEPVQPAPVKDDASIINGTGEVSQDITLASTGLEDIVCGPETGTITIKGDLKIADYVSGKISLRNVIIEGSLTVDTPNASVIIESTTKVTGKTTNINVANQTFTNNGSLEEVELTDADRTRFINGEGASIGTLTINTSGNVILGGTLPNAVVEEAATVINLEVRAPVTSGLSSTAKIETLKANETVTLNGDWKVTKITGSKANGVTGENSSIKDAVNKVKVSTPTGKFK